MTRAGALLLLVVLGAPLAAAQAAPVAYFTVSPDPAGTGATVTVDASESRPGAGGNLTEHAWRWRAGEAYEPGNVTSTHRYSSAGVHEIGLRVTDSGGAVSYHNRTLLVKGARPVADFFLLVFDEDGELRIVANATFSTASRGAKEIVKHEWDWGDGGGFRAGNATETHVYDEPGEYKVTLRVTDDEGRSGEEMEPVVYRSTFWTRMLKVWERRSEFLEGAALTVTLAVVTTILGFGIAIILALMRISRSPILSWPAAAYIEIIRGTPLLVQILVAWLVLPFLGIRLPALWAGGLALIVNTSAYQAEAIRGGIMGIPSGQMEAARSLGFTHLQAMRHVILPQAFRLTLPPLGNEFIILLKDTSLVSAIGVVELTQVGKIFSGQTFLVLETWLGVAFIYFVMTYALSLGLRWLERRLAVPGLGLPTGGTA